MRNFLLTLVVVGMGWSCFGSGETTSCSDESTAAECLPADFNYQTEGEASPPSVDEATAALSVLESGTVTVTASGGTLNLGQVSVTIPAGAMPAGATLDVSELAFDGGPEEQGVAVFRFVGSSQPSAPVDISFQVPGDTQALAENEVYVAWFHGTDEPEAIACTLEGATCKVQATHFSTAVVINNPPIDPWMPGTSTIARVPYYNQGSTGNCWSVSMAMLLAAYGAYAKPWHPNALFGINTEDGLSFYPFVYSSAIQQGIELYLPDARTERNVWFMLTSAINLKNYLIDRLSRNRPVMVYFKSPAAHMVLFVGYDWDNQLFVVHDPAVGPYIRMTWEQVAARFKTTGFDQAATLALKDEPAVSTELEASIWFPFAGAHNEGVDLMKLKKNGNFDTSSVRVFTWYSKALKQWGMVDPATSLPSSVELEHRLFVTAAVVNYLDPQSPEGGGTRSYTVGWELLDDTDGLKYRGTPQKVDLKGGEFRDNLKLIDLPRGFPLDSELSHSGTYKLRVYIEDSLGEHDQASFQFKVDPVCGDGYCDSPAEDDWSCPEDCEYECGNGKCNTPEEHLYNCPEDCGDVCGDGFCTGPETADDCVEDCHCGDHVCQEEYGEKEDCSSDCTCGNGYCQEYEDDDNCHEDCHCGNGKCEPEMDETIDSCSKDCYCGDGDCQNGEGDDPSDCPEDCGFCGDGHCFNEIKGGEESAMNCTDDCGFCGNGTCEPDKDECKLDEVYGLACMADCCTPDIQCPDVSQGFCEPW